MKFTVRVLGVDNGLIERLIAAADRKLAPKLARLAIRHARHTAGTTPHVAAISHPHPTHHALRHRGVAHHTSSPASLTAARAAVTLAHVLAGGSLAASRAAGSAAFVASDPSLVPLSDDLDAFDGAATADSADIVSIDSASSSSGATVFDISLDPDFP